MSPISYEHVISLGEQIKTDMSTYKAGVITFLENAQAGTSVSFEDVDKYIAWLIAQKSLCASTIRKVNELRKSKSVSSTQKSTLAIAASDLRNLQPELQDLSDGYDVLRDWIRAQREEEERAEAERRWHADVRSGRERRPSM